MCFTAALNHNKNTANRKKGIEGFQSVLFRVEIRCIYTHRDRDPVPPSGLVNSVSVAPYWISKKDLEPVIQMSQNIVFNEKPCTLDPSECDNPTCPYSRGVDHMEMRYLLLLRLYQLNNLLNSRRNPDFHRTRSV